MLVTINVAPPVLVVHLASRPPHVLLWLQQLHLDQCLALKVSVGIKGQNSAHAPPTVYSFVTLRDLTLVLSVLQNLLFEPIRDRLFSALNNMVVFFVTITSFR